MTESKRDRLRRSGRRKSYPLPEVFGQGGWNIAPTGAGDGYMERATHTLGIPLGDTPAERAIRAHEQAHIAWTPPEAKPVPGVHPAILNNVEDARINSRLIAEGITYVQDNPPITEEEAVKRCGDSVAGGLAALAAVQGQAPELVDAVERRCEQIVPYSFREEAREVLRRVTRRGASWADTVAVAEELQEIVGAYEEAKDLADEYAEGDGKGLGLDVVEGDSIDPDSEGFARGGWGSGGGDYENDWCEMEIIEPPRTERLPARLRGMRRRYTAEGVIPNAWHREEVDGAIFSTKLKSKAGSVLIDVSGSMSLHTDEVLGIMRANPGVVVAMYSGDGRSPGALVILAKKERAVTGDVIEGYQYGGNTIDGPALGWLAQQPKPRYWICDGVVTGKGDSAPSAAMKTEVIRTCLKYRIARIADVRSWQERQIEDAASAVAEF